MINRGGKSLIKVVCLMSLIHLSSALALETLYGGYLGDMDQSQCTKCPPGYGVIKACNGTWDTLCQLCAAGSFSNIWTLDQQCQPCSTCQKEHYERKPCAPMKDTECSACPVAKDEQGSGGGHGNENYLIKCEKRTTRFPMFPPTPPATKPTPSTERHHSPIETSQGGEPDTTEEQPIIVLPVVTSKLPLQSTLKTTLRIQELTSTLKPNTSQYAVMGPGVGQVKGAGFQWPLLIAGIAAALVFFIVGILVSICLARAKKRRKRQPLENGTEARTHMVPHNNGYKAPPINDTVDGTEERKPIYSEPLLSQPPGHNGSVSGASTPDKKSPIVARDGKMRKSFNRRAPYIDADPQDPMVRGLGRPPSVRYQDGGKPPSLLGGLADRFRKLARRTSSGSDVDRSPSFKSQTSVEERKPFVDGTNV